MRRAVLYPLVCALALATAVALLGAAAFLGDARVGSPSSGAATEAAVRRFYAAANTAILTGDGATLAAAVGPDLVDHAPAPGVSPDRTGLVRYLVTLRATAPGAELVVEEVVAAGDRALAWVAVRGADRGGFLGLPPATERPLWGKVDAWRVADGRVVERWGGAERLALLEPLGRVALDAGLPTRPVLELERLVVPPGGVIEAWRPAEARVIYLEAGALTVAVAPDSPGSARIAPAAAGGAGERQTEVGPGGAGTLRVGDLLALPTLTAYALRNEGAAPAAALVMTLSRAGGAAYATPPCSSADPVRHPSCAAGAGVTARPLAGRRTTALPAGPLAAAVGRATLAPGAELPVDAADGPALVYAEAGTLGLESDGVEAWIRRGGTGVSGEVAAGALGAGDGALLRLGAAATLRNVGDSPPAVLVLTILPAAGGRGRRG